MDEAAGSGLVRELGLTEALALGLGTMIGAGIFVLSAIAAHRAGPAAALSYVAAGLICLPVAMTVSELATGMPRAGGSYHLISRTLGRWLVPWWAWATGWHSPSPPAST